MDKNVIKIRISHGKNIAFGPGKADLLDAIQQLGSISAAAKSMKMSYRRAWELVNVMNQCFKEPLVASATGGQHGGGASLTALGKSILQNYRDLVEKSNDATKQELALILSSFKSLDQ